MKVSWRTSTPLILLPILATACSTPSPVPSDVCEVRIEKSNLAPLLPKEGELKQQSSDLSAPDGSICEVGVDGSVILRVESEPIENPLPPEDWTPSTTIDYRRGKETAVSFPGRALVGDRGAFIQADCGDPKYLLFRIRYSPIAEQPAAGARHLKTFIEDYVPSTTRKLGCAKT